MFITDIVKTNLQTLCLFCAKNCLKRTLNKYICKHIFIGRSGKYRLYDKSATAVCLKYIKNYRMNIHELMPKFPPSCYIKEQILLVNPNEFHRLEGIDIDSSRVFIVVSEGSIDINLNGKRCHIESCSCIDSLDTVTIRIEKCEKDARAWCMLVTYIFARNSLKNFKPVPIEKLLQTQDIPIHSFTKEAISRVDTQLSFLADAIAAKNHYYHNELAAVFYKSMCLELGNAIMSNETTIDDMQQGCRRSEAVALDFTKLVTKYFTKQHNIDFYAQALNMSAKHLTRIIKNTMGRTPHTVICDEITHEAMALLDDDRMTIGLISEKLGFSDQAAFCKFFKRQVSISPTEYRLKNKKSD